MKRLVLLLCALAAGVAQGREPVVTKKFMVAAANPLAAEAGAAKKKRWLGARRGDRGAGDALPGRARVLRHRRRRVPALLVRGSENKLRTYDGRETAPAAVASERGVLILRYSLLFTFMDAVVGGRSVGVPGVLRMLEAGAPPPWPAAVERAVRCGDPHRGGGFRSNAEAALGARGRKMICAKTRRRVASITRGERIVNREYADTLRLIARAWRGCFLLPVIVAKDIALGRAHARRAGRPYGRRPALPIGR